MSESVRGRFTIENYDRAVLNRLAAQFIEFPLSELQKRYPDIPDFFERRLANNIRQVDIECVDGVGKEGRVPVLWDIPESIYTKFVLPAIKVSRNGGFDHDSQRRTAENSGLSYREPSPDAEQVIIETPNGLKKGYTEYIERRTTEPVELSYTIEVRSEYRNIANDMMHYVFSQFRPRSLIPVRTTKGRYGQFTLFFDGSDETSNVASVRDKYHGWTLQYSINAEIDAHTEYKVQPITDVETNQISREHYEEGKES